MKPIGRSTSHSGAHEAAPQLSDVRFLERFIEQENVGEQCADVN
jgi:hypothetical protein